MMREEEMIRDKLRFFLDRKIKVHISIKNSEQFYNGFVVEFQGDDGVVFNDNKFGETLVFISQIKFVEPMKDAM